MYDEHSKTYYTEKQKKKMGKRFFARKRFPMRKLVKAFSGKCHYCGIEVAYKKSTLSTASNAATRDHVVPISAGGTNAKHNIVLACLACNQNKADVSGKCQAEWMESTPLQKALHEQLKIIVEWRHQKKMKNNPDTPKWKAQRQTALWFAGKMGLIPAQSRFAVMTPAQFGQGLEICYEYRKRKGF